MTESKLEHGELLSLTADVVSAHVSNNAVPNTELPGLIETVFYTLSGLGVPEPEPEVELKPAVPIKRSITPDYLICLEDGRKFKSLKRHLRTKFDMSPEDYRRKWRLPADYPMVAPNYAKARSALAKEMGLGQRRG